MLLFSLGVVVSVELSVAPNMHTGENEMRKVRQQRTCQDFFSIFRERLVESRSFFFSLQSSSLQAREIIPQNFSFIGLAVSEELWNKQTNRLIDILYCFEDKISRQAYFTWKWLNLLKITPLLFTPFPSKVGQPLISIKAQQSVSKCVCLFVCLFPNSSETANPSELKF